MRDSTAILRELETTTRVVKEAISSNTTLEIALIVIAGIDLVLIISMFFMLKGIKDQTKENEGAIAKAMTGIEQAISKMTDQIVQMRREHFEHNTVFKNFLREKEK